MKAFKSFNPDMTCRGMQYKVGEHYKNGLCAIVYEWYNEDSMCSLYETKTGHIIMRVKSGSSLVGIWDISNEIYAKIKNFVFHSSPIVGTPLKLTAFQKFKLFWSARLIADCGIKSTGLGNQMLLVSNVYSEPVTINGKFFMRCEIGTPVESICYITPERVQSYSADGYVYPGNE